MAKSRIQVTDVNLMLCAQHMSGDTQNINFSSNSNHAPCINTISDGIRDIIRIIKMHEHDIIYNEFCIDDNIDEYFRQVFGLI